MNLYESYINKLRESEISDWKGLLKALPSCKEANDIEEVMDYYLSDIDWSEQCDIYYEINGTSYTVSDAKKDLKDLANRKLKEKTKSNNSSKFNASKYINEFKKFIDNMGGTTKVENYWEEDTLQYDLTNVLINKLSEKIVSKLEQWHKLKGVHGDFEIKFGGVFRLSSKPFINIFKNNELTIGQVFTLCAPSLLKRFVEDNISKNKDLTDFFSGWWGFGEGEAISPDNFDTILSNEIKAVEDLINYILNDFDTNAFEQFLNKEIKSIKK